MKAIEEWKLTYAQLLEIGKRSGANFNDEQRKVLSGACKTENEGRKTCS